MSSKSLIYRLWYFIWFFALPGIIAWTAIWLLDIANVIEELEIWYVLLVFAVLAFSTYSIREKLPFWQDLDFNSQHNALIRYREAKLLSKSLRKLIRKKSNKISKRGIKEIEESLDKLEKAISDKDDEAIVRFISNIDDKAERYLSRARKSPGRETFESIGIAILVAVILRLFVLEAFKIPSESMVPTLMVGDHIFVSKYRYGLSIPLSNKRLVRFAKPAYGDVVVFIKPKRNNDFYQNGFDEGMDPNEKFGVDFIKRIVALPGDTVEVKEGIVFINGVQLPRCRVGSQKYRTRDRIFGKWHDTVGELWVEKHGDRIYSILEEPGTHKLDNFGPAKVPKDNVFVMGDNRDNSSDSREWGFAPFDNIKGRAMFIWWSNRRPHGFQWDRVGTLIMDDPKLTEEQKQAFDACPNL